MNKHTIEYLFLLSLILFSCKRDFSVTDTYNIHLTLESAEVTEAWLRLKATPVDAETIYTVKRDTHTVFFGKLNRADTLLHDENLEPNHTYKYLVWRGTSIVAKEFITTMDTTSHNFEWQTFEFGAKNNSVFYDVAIINENDIWAVGEIYTEDTYTYDSLGNWIKPYNAAHWDGEKWELKRILYKGGFWAINTVYAFNSEDIWFEAYVKWNGEKYIELEIPQIMTGFGINKTWGASSKEFYAVGNNGQIRHYDGHSWEKLESGTELGLTDIWGTSSNEIYSVGYNPSFYTGIVLKYDGFHWEKMIESPDEFDPVQLFRTQLYGTTGGVWMDEKGTLYTVGNLMYQYKMSKWNYVTSLPENFIGGKYGYRGYLHAVRGNASNDIFIFGQSNTIIHFNGLSWKWIGPAFIPWYPSWWLECAVKDALIVGVGTESYNIERKAKIIMIRRE